MPEFRLKIAAAAREIDAELASLPELPSVNQLLIVKNALANVGGQVKQHLQGESSRHLVFQNHWRNICERFCKAVLDMKPSLHLGAAMNRVVINLDDDGDESSSGSPFSARATPTPSRYRTITKAEQTPRLNLRGTVPFPSQAPHNAQNRPTSRPGIFSTPTRRPNQANPPSSQARTPNGNRDPYAHCRHTGKKWTLLEIRSLIVQYMPAGMSDVVNHAVRQDMCMSSMAQWYQPIEVFLFHTKSLFRKMIFDCLDDGLEYWQQTQLFRDCRKILDDYLSELEMMQAGFNKEIFELETFRLFTLIEPNFSKNKADETKLLNDRRTECRAKEQVRTKVEREFNKKNFEDDEEKAVALEAALKSEAEKILNDKARKIEEILGKDPFACEIEVAAYARGYYVTAAHRFVEDICRFTQGKLFRTVENNIDFLLADKLQLSGVNEGKMLLFLRCNECGDTDRVYVAAAIENCNALMEEDNGTAQRRRDLVYRRSQLAKSQEHLDKLSEDLGNVAWDQDPSRSTTPVDEDADVA